jgi:hypothetical protein
VLLLFKLFLAKQLSMLCKARGLPRLQLLSAAQPARLARPGRWAAEITVTTRAVFTEIPDGSLG